MNTKSSSSPNSSSSSNLIKARHNFFGGLLIFWLARRSLHRTFHSVRFRAAAPLPAPPSRLDIPVVFYSNHMSWWDGYLAYMVTRQVYGLRGYLMMEVSQLRRYRFFTWAGVFSVDQQNGREALRSMNYVAEEVKGGPGRAIWIFPQGTILPQERRPLDFHTGLAYLIRRVGQCYVYPVAFRVEYLYDQHPNFLLDVGPARLVEAGQRFDPKKLTAELEADLTAQLDRLRDSANAFQLDDFVTIIKGKQGVDKLFDKAVRWLPFLKPKA